MTDDRRSFVVGLLLLPLLALARRVLGKDTARPFSAGRLRREPELMAVDASRHTKWREAMLKAEEAAYEGSAAPRFGYVETTDEHGKTFRRPYLDDPEFKARLHPGTYPIDDVGVEVT